MSEEIVTYIYDDKEVYLTGRMAKPSKGSKLDYRVEIVPVGTTYGDRTYAKWVSMKDLMTIVDIENDDIIENKDEINDDEEVDNNTLHKSI